MLMEERKARILKTHLQDHHPLGWTDTASTKRAEAWIPKTHLQDHRPININGRSKRWQRPGSRRRIFKTTVPSTSMADPKDASSRSDHFKSRGRQDAKVHHQHRQKMTERKARHNSNSKFTQKK
jgi:hypothetical protein